MNEGQGLTQSPVEATPDGSMEQPTASKSELLQQRFLEHMTDLVNLHRNSLGSPQLTSEQIDDYEELAFNVFSFAKDVQPQVEIDEVLERLQNIGPLSEEVKAAISRGLEGVNQIRAEKELRETLLVELREKFVATLLDKGYSPDQVDVAAEMVNHYSGDFLSPKAFRQEVLKQAQQRGLDTSNVGKDIE